MKYNGKGGSNGDNDLEVLENDYRCFCPHSRI